MIKAKIMQPLFPPPQKKMVAGKPVDTHSA
jgi:hypothetical protein